jgi:hypothetical protein
MSPPTFAINSGQELKAHAHPPNPKKPHFQHQNHHLPIPYQSPCDRFTKSASTSTVQSFNMHQQIYIIIHYFLSICVLVTNLLK